MMDKAGAAEIDILRKSLGRPDKVVTVVKPSQNTAARSALAQTCTGLWSGESRSTVLSTSTGPPPSRLACLSCSLVRLPNPPKQKEIPLGLVSVTCLSQMPPPSCRSTSFGRERENGSNSPSTKHHIPVYLPQPFCSLLQFFVKLASGLSVVYDPRKIRILVNNHAL
ncbi:hypothetical protein BD289DRAFT_291114 [Coniella lustricola]|uniref:Uncharacterized protein n=1 Tax=Coniella lustricola TaxID=2025994 RepID=A0A2T3A563_9PEZI|nr:hypothetical protein BD289DRAFT_291114 [Coniella lustricola]